MISDLRNIRLGFVSSRSAWCQDGVWTGAGVGRLVDGLRKQFPHITVALCNSLEKKPLHDHRLNLSSDHFVGLPFIASLANGFPKARICKTAIRAVESRSDVLIVQLPFDSPLALLKQRRPRLYHICSDVRKMAQTSPAYRGPKRLAAVTAGAIVNGLHCWLFRDGETNILTNGDDLLRYYGKPNGRSIVSSAIYQREVMSEHRQRDRDAPFRVLFVGFLRAEKGIDILIEAFDGVLDALPGAELTIVGARADIDRDVRTPMYHGLQKLRERGTVQFLGHRYFGPQLFKCFADADVLAVPSCWEGTPRVLVEARAFGCPVIGSMVGGIPSSIEHEVDGLLVPPQNPRALRDAILRIARDPELRDRLVSNGLNRARRTTVEQFVNTMAEEVEQLANQNRSLRKELV